MSLYVILLLSLFSFFFFNDTATTEIYTLSLHDALPICCQIGPGGAPLGQIRKTAVIAEWHHLRRACNGWIAPRSEEHTSELQSQSNLVCRLLLEKKKKQDTSNTTKYDSNEPRELWD